MNVIPESHFDRLKTNNEKVLNSNLLSLLDTIQNAYCHLLPKTWQFHALKNGTWLHQNLAKMGGKTTKHSCSFVQHHCISSSSAEKLGKATSLTWHQTHWESQLLLWFTRKQLQCPRVQAIHVSRNSTWHTHLTSCRGDSLRTYIMEQKAKRREMINEPHPPSTPPPNIITYKTLFLLASVPNSSF